MIEDFRKAGEAVAWLGFDFDGESQPQKEYLDNFYGEYEKPEIGVMGPIFYSTREAFGKALNFMPPMPKDRTEMAIFERVIPVAFKKAGYEFKCLERYDNERIDTKRDYIYFDKLRPNRT